MHRPFSWQPGPAFAATTKAGRLTLSAMCTLFALVLLAATGASAADKPLDLVPIEIAPGLTTIPGFTPDNRPATVLKLWRENGNAHSYSIYAVSTADNSGRGGWNVVPVIVPTPFHVSDTLRDDPHASEDVVRSVRFARGRIGGEQTEALLLIATREVKDVIPDPAPVTFELYHAVVTDEMGDVLERVRTWRSAKSYCNADMALLREVGLALPRDYEGGQSDDGCL